MINLFSSFPPDYQDSFLNRLLKPKIVLKLFTPETTPPKEKRFIVVGETESVLGLVIINSELNENVFPVGHPNRSAQIELSCFDGCKYLDHDSFADCSTIHHWNKLEVATILSNDDERILGTITDSHWNVVIQTLVNARNISRKMKIYFGIIPPTN
jgi:hypothetical protein